MFQNSNITEEVCPVCGKKLRFKPACCSDKNEYLVCPCGYKKVKVKNEIGSLHSSR
jgi:predicted amidophosphoribosyltransferase